MATRTDSFSHPLMWTAGIAVILFSALGIAAIMGWIPTSMGRGSESGVMTAPGNQSGDATNPATGKATGQPSSSDVTANSAAAPAGCAECGVVTSTHEVTSKGEGSGIGAVGGAVVGGLLGHQIGNGTGNTVATAIGAVGGVMAGNEVEKRMTTSTSYRVTVHMDDGTNRVISEKNLPAWRTGDHVKIASGVIHSNP